MKLLNKSILYILPILLLVCTAFGEKSTDNGDFGDSNAVKGGELNLYSSEFPKSFNLFVNNAVDAADVFNLVYDTLLDLNPNTLEFRPLIAASWSISPDKRVFTFKIDPRAKWSDGKPITAQDVKFTYDVIMNTNNLTSVMRIFLSRFEEPVLIDDLTIKITARTVHFKNFNNLVTLINILPKHLYEGKDFNKSFNMDLPGASGPYSLSEVKDGRYYILTRRKDYWAQVLPYRRYLFNFDKIKYKIIRDENVAFEAFKKGDFDVFSQITPKRWVTETDSEKFKKNWIIKQKIYNHHPRGIRGIALNMRKPLFQDIRVRKALFMLLDRKTIIEKLMFNFYQPLSSYWPSLSASKPYNEPLTYDPVKAKLLLQQAGFNKLDKNGYLLNQKGERLEFSVLSIMDENVEKYLTVFVESCKAVGVKVNLDLTSWATLIKKMDEYNFDTVTIGWTADLFEDPEQLWHSRHKDEIGGSNLPGYKNEKVDALIDSLPPMFNATERNDVIKEIDRLIYNDVPYILFWWVDYYAVFYKNAFGMPKTFVPKYGSDNFNIENGIIYYWWYDPVKVKRLQEAYKNNTPLPPETENVYYDKLTGK